MALPRVLCGSMCKTISLVSWLRPGFYKSLLMLRSGALGSAVPSVVTCENRRRLCVFLCEKRERNRGAALVQLWLSGHGDYFPECMFSWEREMITPWLTTPLHHSCSLLWAWYCVTHSPFWLPVGRPQAWVRHKWQLYGVLLQWDFMWILQLSQDNEAGQGNSNICNGNVHVL